MAGKPTYSQSWTGSKFVSLEGLRETPLALREAGAPGDKIVVGRLLTSPSALEFPCRRVVQTFQVCERLMKDPSKGNFVYLWYKQETEVGFAWRSVSSGLDVFAIEVKPQSQLYSKGRKTPHTTLFSRVAALKKGAATNNLSRQ